LGNNSTAAIVSRASANQLPNRSPNPASWRVTSSIAAIANRNQIAAVATAQIPTSSTTKMRHGSGDEFDGWGVIKWVPCRFQKEIRSEKSDDDPNDDPPNRTGRPPILGLSDGGIGESILASLPKRFPLPCLDCPHLNPHHSREVRSEFSQNSARPELGLKSW
jgi:hypothetical protein